MDISINAEVKCSDGQCGRSMGVILIPVLSEVTHIEEREETNPVTEYLISIDLVIQTTPNVIRLSCSNGELLKMQIFGKMVSGLPIPLRFPRTPYMTWSLFLPAIPYISLEKEPVPADEFFLHLGARIDAIDGHVGHVSEFLINPFNDQITNLEIREDYLWGQKEVTIPVSQIDHYENNTDYLKINKQEIEKLPKKSVLRK